MSAQAGPSRSHPPLHIDLGNIMVDQPRYTSPLQTSSSSTAPSLSIHRSSTQSGFSWNGPQTPRTERLSLTSSEWSISEDDVVSFGRDAERSISSVMLDEGKTGGWWVDLDKTPRASDTMRKNPHFPSRLSSLPKQHPIPPSPKSQPSIAPIPERIDDELVALPDDSPLMRPYPMDSGVPPLELAIPPFNPDRPKKIPYDQLPTTPETLAKFPVPHPISMVPFQPASTANGPAPPIPPRRSSRKERSGQSSEGKKQALTNTLGSLGTRPPPPPPPRASSLRSASARAAMSAATSMPAVHTTASSASSSETAIVAVTPQPIIAVSPTTLSRQPRVRSRSAQLPVKKPPREDVRDRQPSHISLSSILEDEQLPDMEATPEGSWALRRQKHRLTRAKSQPRLRKTRNLHGPWRLLNSTSGFCCV